MKKRTKRTTPAGGVTRAVVQPCGDLELTVGAVSLRLDRPAAEEVAVALALALWPPHEAIASELLAAVPTAADADETEMPPSRTLTPEPDPN